MLMLCGGFYLIFGFSFRDVFPAPEGTPTSFCTKPNPDAANFSLRSPHLFRTATTILQDDLKSVSHHPTLRTQGAFAQNPPHQKAPHFSISPPPHQREIFNFLGGNINSHVHFFFFRQVSSRQAGKMAHTLRNPVLSKISDTVWRLRLLEVDNMFRPTT
jgi:hypothetical protein